MLTGSPSGGEAEDHSRVVDGSHGSLEQCDVPGRVSGRTIAVGLPISTSHEPASGDAPCLEYDVVLDTPGAVTVDVQCVPTQALNAERDLRYTVGFAEGERRTVSIDPQGGEHDPEWQQNVLRGAAIGTSEHRIEEPGTHTLRLWALDPGLVVDRIVVYADGERTTYLGPRETSVDG